MKLNYSDDRTRAIKAIDESQLVCAAAGTGKTTVLIQRYLAILEQGNANPQQIVAITFTEKAADEMRTRLRSALGKPDCPLTPPAIAAVLNQLDSAPISTVHSFCLRLLRDNVMLLGIDPLFQIIDETEEELLRRDFMQQYFQRQLETQQADFAALLEYADLSQIEKWLNVLYEKQTEWLPDLLEFMNQPPEKVLEQIVDFSKQINAKLYKELFDSIEARTLWNELDRLQPLNPDDSLAQAFQQLQVLYYRFQKGQIDNDFYNSLKQVLNGKIKGSEKNWDKDILERARALRSGFIQKFKQIADDWIFIEEPAGELPLITLAQTFARLGLDFLTQYRLELSQHAKMDFNGIEIETERLLQQPASSLQTYVQNIRHLLVDEFQDINPIQYRIIQALQRLNPQIVTFFVGDEKQSIYRFRGADVEIFTNLRRQFSPLQLAENYRSNAALMDFFNNFFMDYLGKNAPARPFEVHYPIAIQAYDRRAAGHIPVTCLQVTDSDEKSPNALKIPMLQATFVAQYIQELLQQPIIREGEGWRTARYGDMVVLLRARTHQAAFEQVFKKAGIPYYIVAGIGFFQQREIIDIVNFLRVLLNPSDLLALVATLRSPLVGVSDRTLTRFSDNSGILENLYNYLFGSKTPPADLSAEDLEPLARFRQLHSQLQPLLMTSTTAAVLQAIVDQTYYLPFLAAQTNGSQMVANVYKLIDLALNWEHNRTLSPIDFIRRIQTYREQEVHEGDANLASEFGDTVRIMTIHAAKGLDFPIVFVPFPEKLRSRNDGIMFNHLLGLSLNCPPSPDQKDSALFECFKKCENQREYAEEQRLLYVATTRAKDYLVLSLPPLKSNSKNKNPWHRAIDYLDAMHRQNLCHFQYLTTTELEDYYFKLEPQIVETAPLISSGQLSDLRKQIQPVTVESRIERLIATDFAALQSHEAPSHRQPIGSEPETVLPATTLGSIIHQVFAWWDFRDLKKVESLTAELLKPYLLTAQESAPIYNLVRAWAKLLLNKSNELTDLINTAARIEREVELCGLYEDTILEGKADMLLYHNDGSLSIVDFKSDHVEGAPPPELLQKYTAQLNFYAFILDKCNHLSIRTLALYFIRSGSLVVTPWNAGTSQPTETQIKQVIRSSAT